MKIKRILWVLAAFVFTGTLYAQRGQVPTVPSQPQTQSATSSSREAQMATQGQTETGQKKTAQAQGPVEMTEKEVTKEIKSSPAETVIKDVKQRGVDFDMTPDIEKKLRKAKATDEVIQAVRQAGPKVRAQMARVTLGTGPTGVQDIPKEQVAGYDAIRGELDPDKTVALVQDFAKKYPNSPLLSFVYMFGANAYQQKGEADKVVELSDESLKLRADNVISLVMKVGMLPQPQYLSKHEAERDKILQEAESEGNRALQLILQVPKQPNETEADHQKRLANAASQVHGSLGMVHLERAAEPLAGPDKAELAKAEQEFKTAVTTTDRPDPSDYYRMGEAYTMDGKLDDAMDAFTKASLAGQGTMLKAYADQRIEELKKKKAQGAAAPNPK
jgi:tetratricopeptide (TPR) repeat protein